MAVEWDDDQGGIEWDEPPKRNLGKYLGQRALSGLTDSVGLMGGISAANLMLPGLGAPLSMMAGPLSGGADPVSVGQGAIRQGAEGIGLPSREELAPTNTAERYGGAAAEFAGAGVPFGPAAGARLPAQAANLGIGAGQGLIYEGAKQASGGNELVAAAASMAAPFAPSAAAAGTRAALGGGTRNMAGPLAQAQTVPGYRPTAGEAGGGFLTRWLERLGGTTLGSTGATHRRAAETDEVLRAAVDDLAGRAEDAAGVNRGTASTAEAAGIAVRKGLNEDADSWLSRSRASARRADGAAARAIQAAEQQTGRQVRVSVAPVLDELDNVVSRQSTLGELPTQLGDPDVIAVRQALEDIAAPGNFPTGQAGSLTFQQARELRAIVGNMTNWSGAAPNRDTALWRRVYGQISDEIANSVRALPSVRVGNRQINPGTAFSQSQARWRQHFDRVENFFDPIMARSAEPDQIASMALSVNRPVRIRELRRMVGEKRWNQVRAFAMRQMGQARPSTIEGTLASGEEAFSPITFATNWNKARQTGALNEIFGGAPAGSRWRQLRLELDNLATVIGRIQASRTALANPSGTAGRLMAYQQLGSVGAGVGAAAMGHPSILAGIIAGQGSIAIGARAMMSPRFVRWLAQDGQIPTANLAVALARLQSVINAERDPEAKKEMEALRDQLRAQAAQQ